jgi:hypothetical protein
MFSEERCPHCACGDYEVDDYTEDYQDDYYSREWVCTCGNCKSQFTITYVYELKRVEVSGS